MRAGVHDPIEGIQLRYKAQPLFPELDEEMEVVSMRRKLMPPSYIVAAAKKSAAVLAQEGGPSPRHQVLQLIRKRKGDMSSAENPREPSDFQSAPSFADDDGVLSMSAVLPEPKSEEYQGGHRECRSTPWRMASVSFQDLNLSSLSLAPLPPPLVRPVSVHTFMCMKGSFELPIAEEGHKEYDDILGNARDADSAASSHVNDVDFGCNGFDEEPDAHQHRHPSLRADASAAQSRYHSCSRRNSAERTRAHRSVISSRSTTGATAPERVLLTSGKACSQHERGRLEYDADRSSGSETDKPPSQIDGRPSREVDRTARGSSDRVPWAEKDLMRDLDEHAILQHACNAVAEFYSKNNPNGRSASHSQTDQVSTSLGPQFATAAAGNGGGVLVGQEAWSPHADVPVDMHAQKFLMKQQAPRVNSRLSSTARDAFARGSAYWDSLLRSSGLSTSKLNSGDHQGLYPQSHELMALHAQQLAPNPHGRDGNKQSIQGNQQWASASSRQVNGSDDYVRLPLPPSPPPPSPPLNAQDMQYSVELAAQPWIESKARMMQRLDEMERKSDAVLRLIENPPPTDRGTLTRAHSTAPFHHRDVNARQSDSLKVLPRSAQYDRVLGVSAAFDGTKLSNTTSAIGESGLRDWGMRSAPDFSKAAASVLRSTPRNTHFAHPGSSMDSVLQSDSAEGQFRVPHRRKDECTPKKTGKPTRETGADTSVNVDEDGPRLKTVSFALNNTEGKKSSDNGGSTGGGGGGIARVTPAPPIQGGGILKTTTASPTTSRGEHIGRKNEKASSKERKANGSMQVAIAATPASASVPSSAQPVTKAVKVRFQEGK